MTKKATMKYSTWIKEVFIPACHRHSEANGGRFFVCNVLIHSFNAETDPFAAKLMKTVKAKLARKANQLGETVLTFYSCGMFNDADRIRWLLSIAAIHENKGN